MQPPLTDERDLGSQLQISTVSLTNEYKRPVPDSMEWVLIRTYTHVVRNGRYDVDAFVIDPATSEILALSRHIIYVKPHQVSLKQLVADKEGNEAAKM